MPCPKCGRMLPAIPGYVVCLGGGATWVILPPSKS